MPVFFSILKHYGSPEEQVLPSAGSHGSGINFCWLPWQTLPSAGPYDPNKLENIFPLFQAASEFSSVHISLNKRICLNKFLQYEASLTKSRAKVRSGYVTQL